MRALGLTLPAEAPVDDTEIPAAIRNLADARWQARLAKNWTESDTLRARLLADGWLVKDGKDGYTLEPV